MSVPGYKQEIQHEVGKALKKQQIMPQSKEI